MHFRRTVHQPQATGGTDALLRLQQLDDGSLNEEEDSPAEISGLYQRALILVRDEFEERTWTMFWEVVIESRAPNDVASDLNVTPAAVRKVKSRVLRRLKVEVGDVIS